MAEVVYAGKCAGKRLADFKLVAKKRFREAARAAIAIAANFDRLCGSEKSFVGKMDFLAGRCPDGSVACVARWQYAVEHIDAVIDGDMKIFGRPNTEEKTRLGRLVTWC